MVWNLPNWIDSAFFYIFLGGGLGSVLRYILFITFQNHSSSFPVSTLLVNVLGSFLIGVTVSIIPDPDSSGLKQFLGFGVLGGFTTFSTFSLDTIRMLHHGETLVSICYVLGTLVLCLVGTSVGWYLGSKF